MNLEGGVDPGGRRTSKEKRAVQISTLFSRIITVFTEYHDTCSVINHSASIYYNVYFAKLLNIAFYTCTLLA